MEAINKLGKELAKDFEKRFEGLNEDQLEVLKQTTLYRIFANVPKTGKYSHNPPRLDRRFFKDSNTSYDVHYASQAKIIATLYLQRFTLKDVEAEKTIKSLLDSNDVDNITLAINMLKKLKTKSRNGSKSNT